MGETSRDCYLRGSEHWEDFEKQKEEWMLSIIFDNVHTGFVQLMWIEFMKLLLVYWMLEWGIIITLIK